MSDGFSERAERLRERQDRPADDTGGEHQSVPVNVYETDGALVIVAPLPGVMPDDVEVTVDGTDVTIKAAMRSDPPKDYLVHEWHYGPFERQLTIPEGFGADAKASFGNGQLAVHLGRGAAGASQVIRPG